MQSQSTNQQRNRTGGAIPQVPAASVPVILTTLNSSYFHTAFGLRYLYANLGPWQSRAQILEFTTQQNPRDIAEEILKFNPQVLGIGVYIWNTSQTFELVSILKSIRPKLCIVLGGPEVSYEWEGQPLVALADHVICGEGEIAFRNFLDNFGKVQAKVITGVTPPISDIHLPYAYYTDEDIKNRVLYVEASRGCPYKCEFCLSSLDKSVRAFDLNLFLKALETLIHRGARSFKFVDRTFNLNFKTTEAILKFFLERASLGIFAHFELVPDRLPEELKNLVKRFPKGSLQFEIGIQTWNKEVAALVSRRQDYQKTEDNLRFLKNETGVHLHTDLIAGLPGEDLHSFGLGFDKLFSLKPHEIQVGILKRLKGTPIIRHDAAFQMAYQATPPFPILQNSLLDFDTLQSLQRFAKFWDLIGNSGNFKRSLKLLERLAEKRPQSSIFWQFWELSEFLSRRHPQRHSIALVSLVESLWGYFQTQEELEVEEVRKTLIDDFTLDVSRDIPKFLRSQTELNHLCVAKEPRSTNTLLKRQALHFGNH